MTLLENPRGILNPQGLSRSRMSGGGAAFYPNQLPNLELWTRFNQGITVTGAGVSTWADQSGNGNDLLQGTDTNRPALQGDGSILCDGVDNFLKATFALDQPVTIYILGKQVTWTVGDTIFDGNTLNTGRLFQEGITPNLQCYAGAAGAESTDLILDTDSVITTVFDHDNSFNLLQINNGTSSTDVAFGTNDMEGFTLGANGSNLAFSNSQYKESIIYSAAHDAETRQKVKNYLASVGGLAI